MRAMTRLLSALTASLIIGSCAPAPPTGQAQGPASELAGRVAGPAKRCVSTTQLESLRVSDSDPHLLVYGNSGTIYANPLGRHCSFRHDDVLVMQPTSSEYCRGDLVRSFDRYSHIPGPACVLGDFIPYTRP